MVERNRQEKEKVGKENFPHKEKVEDFPCLPKMKISEKYREFPSQGKNR